VPCPDFGCVSLEDVCLSCIYRVSILHLCRVLTLGVFVLSRVLRCSGWLQPLRIDLVWFVVACVVVVACTCSVCLIDTR
jgi:hypothetical protein